MIVDHICYAVKDMAEAIAWWRDVFGYTQMTKTVLNTRQKVKVTFLRKEGSLTVKLIEPIEGNVSLQNFVNREGGYHHITFRCDDIKGKISELRDKGLRLLVDSQPGEAFSNNSIAFLMGKYNMNIELVDTDEKADILH